MGLGLFLLRTAVVEKIDGPLFSQIAEDRHFCEQLRKSGTPVYCDHRLSMDVGHLVEAGLTF